MGAVESAGYFGFEPSSCLSKFLISYPKVVPMQVMKVYYELQSVPKNLPAITMSLVWEE